MEPVAGSVSPDEAFWLLGEETRLGILRAVWEADDGRASFTEIRESLGNPDSGQFNYHLNKLKGPFLADVEDGYELTQAGREVVRAVMAGTLTRQPETSPEPIDTACVHCGGGLVARYDEYGIVECGDCGATVMWNEFPPAGLAGRTAAEFAAAFDRWTQHRFRLAMDGVCPNCAVEMSMERVESDGNGAEGAGRFTAARTASTRPASRCPATSSTIRRSSRSSPTAGSTSPISRTGDGASWPRSSTWRPPRPNRGRPSCPSRPRDGRSSSRSTMV